VQFGEFRDGSALFSPDSGEDALRRDVAFDSVELLVQAVETILF